MINYGNLRRRTFMHFPEKMILIGCGLEEPAEKSGILR
jgi:hypothetical protein